METGDLISVEQYLEEHMPRLLDIMLNRQKEIEELTQEAMLVSIKHGHKTLLKDGVILFELAAIESIL